MIRELFIKDLSLWTCLWQSTVFAALGLIAGRFLRRRPARAYQVLLFAMIAAVAVPFLSAAVKHFDLGAFVAAEAELPYGRLGMSTGTATSVLDAAVIDVVLSQPIAVVVAAPALSSIPWRTVVLYSWLVATLLLLARLVITFLYGVHLVRHASHTRCKHIQQATDHARSRLGLTSGIEVRVSGRIRSPVVWCWSRQPILLLPNHSDDVEMDWSGIVAHELAHCRRRDHITGLLAEVAASLLPWNPLIWVSKRYLVRLGEEACDDWVVAAGEPSEDYAESLLRFRPQKHMAFLPAVVHSKRGLAARVRRILNDACGNPRAGAKWALTVTIVALCVCLAVAFAQARPASAGTKPEQANPPTKSLHEAAANGDLGEVKRLITQGADVNAKDQRGQRVLHYAVQNGHREMAELLIAQGADVNAGGSGDGTPLLTAVFRDNVDMVRFLIAKGADCNVYDQRGNTPLVYAITAMGEKDKEIVELLIDAGADINLEDKQGQRTPLHSGIFDSSPRVFDVFLAKVTDPDTIHLAALKGDLPKVTAFVQGGTDVNTKDKSGCTPLHWAVLAGTADVADFLLAKGADVSAKDNTGRTPLLGARRLDMIQRLVSEGADVGAKDELGWTVLHRACFRNDKNTAAFLISKGADANAKNNWGMTPLLLASSAGQRDLVELLIAKDADVNMRFWNGPPLFAAAAAGHADVVRLLIAKGAEVNASDNRGRTPLSRAQKEKHTEVVGVLRQHGAIETLHAGVAEEDLDAVTRLLSQGADINAKDNRRATPLWIAARNGQTEFIEFVIAKGADVNAPNNQGLTPLAIAKQRGHTAAIEMLRQHGAKEEASAASESSLPARTLHGAAKAGDLEQVKALLAEGADVNAKEDGGLQATPLHHAVARGHKDVVGLLLEHGADTKVKDQLGQTPLDLAKRRGRDLVEILTKAAEKQSTVEKTSQ